MPDAPSADAPSADVPAADAPAADVPSTLTPAALLAALDRAAARSTSAPWAMASGWRLIERALGSGREVAAVAVSARALQQPTRDEARVLATCAAAAVQVREVADAALAARSEGHTFGALLGLVRRPFETVEEVLAAPGPVLALEAVLDPGNIGAIARSAAALGAGGLIVCGGTDPLHPKALRTSMGALWRLPLARWRGDVPGLLAMARDRGRPAVAAALDGRVVAAGDGWGLPSGGPAPLLCLGGEAHGLRPATAAACDVRICLAMPGDDGGASVDSLSVAAAAAVLLWEARARAGSPA